MKPIPYLELLKQAFSITWKNKFLWVFGLFVSLGSCPSTNWTSDNGNESEIRPGVVADFISAHLGFFIGAVIVFFVLVIAFLVLRIIGIAALTKAANNISVYSQSTIKSIFLEAKDYFWRLFLAGFLVGIVLAGIVLVLAIPAIYLFAVKEYVLGAVSLVAAFLIFFPLVVIAYFLKRFATFYIVLGNTKTIAALESAYAIFRKNIKESLIMGCINIAINMVLGVGVLFCVLIVAVVFAPIGFIAYWIFAKVGVFVVLAVAGLVALVILLILLSWYASFVQTIWVLFFQQIVFEKKEEEETAEKVEAKVDVPSPEAV